MKVCILFVLIAVVFAFETAYDCEKAPDSGMCRGYFPRYYYDPEAGQCKEFIYGGCGGNLNNFKTEEECKNRCGA
ncbi:KappaPI-stichotoxin-Shd2a like protein [Argiope bruennichi]|uniref:KappaPI-stichotoxin-Shd2a like protein n=1 Tax=Argiope bruennichi TaxID=94029 RepID=A0A8T0DZL4_ARGBR|nr:KappaPI-stichotoxin-Shd2a like protein [Argiope bruennichi]